MGNKEYRTGEPYKLDGSRIVFTNWYFVRPCVAGWYDDHGNNVNVYGEQGAFDAKLRHIGQPWGIRLSVGPAVPSGPVLKAEYPWEEGGVHIYTIIKEKGIYRAWGTTGWGDLKNRGNKYFCYFESEDGLEWKRPDCNIVEYAGNCNNNLLCTEGGSVFIDPSAHESERYKWVAEHHFSREEFEEYRKCRPHETDAKSIRLDAGLFVGVQGAVSPDGLHWTAIPQPLAMMHSDTQVVAYYDTFLKKYVGYFRDWMVGKQAENSHDEKCIRWLPVARRAIGRAETEDFRKFPLSEVIVEPNPEMSPSQVYYTNCRTEVPGAPGQHLMFPAIWDQSNDATCIGLLSSYDGKVWNRISTNPVIDTADFGQWDGGCIFAVPNLLELPNGDFALPYVGYDVPHKYPRANAQRAMGYALWPKGRMVAIESGEKGEFTTVAIVPPGKKLMINAVTSRAGHVLVEALDVDGRVIPGRDMDNAVSIVGDQFMTPVVWKDHGDLGIEPGEAVMLHFRMEEAAIYSLDFK